jgi:hypothetical protein
MKTLVLMGCVIALAGSMSIADMTTAPAPGGRKMGPCKQIIAACESAGFEKGMHKKDGKGLFKDCLDPILAGQTVAGVTVDPSLVPACQAAKAKHQQKMQSQGTTTPPAAQ